ncbi:unnamed protein product [Cylicocyclus nassatus]|uniref:Uncharacterized protein n=1 Tax=Cylicocyclus nassatus TaxID=53992 RepID=A0AA36DSF6_CYLNA|nr:unnamed protein product [Cylicocyclus nassatus]
MLFEVPVDHFPVQCVAATERPHRPILHLRIPQLSLIQRQEVSAAVAPSPSVLRSQFNFCPTFPTLSRTAVVEQATEQPKSSYSTVRPQSRRQPVVHSSSSSRRTFQTPSTLLQLPMRLLSRTMPLQLA